MTKQVLYLTYPSGTRSDLEFAMRPIEQLQQDGLLLKSDTVLPSVATLIAGMPVRGSWWAHPASHAIFRAIDELASRRDVVVVKLIGGKDTFVYSRLWPELLAIAAAREQWQVSNLPRSALNLYKRLLRSGELEASGSDARLLESRLLVRAEQVHTDAGHHEKRLESWERWLERTGLPESSIPSAQEAKDTFERIYPGAKWPWRALRSGHRRLFKSGAARSRR